MKISPSGRNDAPSRSYALIGLIIGVISNPLE